MGSAGATVGWRASVPERLIERQERQVGDAVICAVAQRRLAQPNSLLPGESSASQPGRLAGFVTRLLTMSLGIGHHPGRSQRPRLAYAATVR